MVSRNSSSCVGAGFSSSSLNAISRLGRAARKRIMRAVAIESLESRRLLSVASINSNDAVPFQHITIDPNPGTVPVMKILGDLTNSGKLDAIVGHETTLGGGGLDWYQYPASGNPNDPWIEHVIDPSTKATHQELAVTTSADIGHPAHHPLLHLDPRAVVCVVPTGAQSRTLETACRRAPGVR